MRSHAICHMLSSVQALVAGVSQLAVLILSPGRLTPHTLIFVRDGQWAWYLIVATLMITGRKPFEAVAKFLR